MDSSNYLTMVFAHARALAGSRAAALRAAWRDQDRGASAVELAVITVIILAAAGLLLGVIYNFVKSQSAEIQAPQVGGG
jgi:Flp pilus assembly protein TadG